MSEAIWLIAAGSFSILGMSWLALAMKTHWQQLMDDQSNMPCSSLLRCMGFGALAASGMCCLMADYASIAMLVWVMLGASAAFCVALILSQSPKLLKAVCPKFFAQKSSVGLKCSIETVQ